MDKYIGFIVDSKKTVACAVQKCIHQKIATDIESDTFSENCVHGLIIYIFSDSIGGKS